MPRTMRQAYFDAIAEWPEAERRALKGELLARIRKREDVNPLVGSPCWDWIGWKHGEGYGKFVSHGRTFMAHRIMLAANGTYDDPALVSDHLCRNRLCVRPSHLRFCLQKENVLSGLAPSAENALKFACDRGHPFTRESTYVTPNGWRQCRICLDLLSL